MPNQFWLKTLLIVVLIAIAWVGLSQAQVCSFVRANGGAVECETGTYGNSSYSYNTNCSDDTLHCIQIDVSGWDCILTNPTVTAYLRNSNGGEAYYETAVFDSSGDKLGEYAGSRVFYNTTSFNWVSQVVTMEQDLSDETYVYACVNITEYAGALQIGYQNSATYNGYTGSSDNPIPSSTTLSGPTYDFMIQIER